MRFNPVSTSVISHSLLPNQIQVENNYSYFDNKIIFCFLCLINLPIIFLTFKPITPKKIATVINKFAKYTLISIFVSSYWSYNLIALKYRKNLIGITLFEYILFLCHNFILKMKKKTVFNYFLSMPLFPSLCYIWGLRLASSLYLIEIYENKNKKMMRAEQIKFNEKVKLKIEIKEKTFFFSFPDYNNNQEFLFLKMYKNILKKLL